MWDALLHIISWKSKLQLLSLVCILNMYFFKSLFLQKSDLRNPVFCMAIIIITVSNYALSIFINNLPGMRIKTSTKYITQSPLYCIWLCNIYSTFFSLFELRVYTYFYLHVHVAERLQVTVDDPGDRSSRLSGWGPQSSCPSPFYPLVIHKQHTLNLTNTNTSETPSKGSLSNK